MFFILSKILYFLLIPLVWILILLIWMMLTKSKTRKKKLLIAVVVISILFSNNFIYTRLVLAWQPQQTTIEPGKVYSAGILLGGMVGFDINNKGHFGEGADRFIQTEKLYHQGLIKKILVTSGSGELLRPGLKEADFLEQELIASGVKKEDIIIENNSRNTFENAIYSKKILDSLHIQGPYVLITSAMHMPRSEKIFTKAGMQFVTFPSDYHVTRMPFSFEDAIVPKLKLLNDWAYFLKEFIGLKVYQVTGKA